ncbi:MAG: glycosyltransferase family 4 protein [Bacteroidales bacterium]|nr:glycosyltransferase family 4 protein [Bacteroidales bacterium]
MSDIHDRGIYNDLLRNFYVEGWKVYVVTPRERSVFGGSVLNARGAELSVLDGVQFLHVKTLNLQKTSTIEKGIGQVLVENQYKRAIKKYLGDVKFDLILYSTPPITFSKVIAYLKRHYPRALTYLLLKDIFPQNAMDLGMLSNKGVKGLLYCYFRRKEKILYALSDYIGCMSPANVRYLLANNSDIAPNRVEVAPNSVTLCEPVEVDRESIRVKYGLPFDKPIFIYGGNLGKPQGIPFIIQCLEANADRTDCHFLIIGSGTEFPKLKSWYQEAKPSSVTIMEGLPKAEYDELVHACDVGLIFLDHRFTIPNYPSRLLSYLENKMPVLCATDPNTDIGTIAQDNGYGYWCESNSVDAFNSILDKMINSDRKAMGERGYQFLKDNYLVEHTYNAIMKHV